MRYSSHILTLFIGVTGGLVASYFLQGNQLTQQIINFAIGGVSFGSMVEVLGLIREWCRSNRKDKMEKRIAWKQRILTVLDAYIGSLGTIGRTAIVVPVGEIITDYGWPEVNHKKEAQKFLERFKIYRAWEKNVEKWDEYYEASKEEQVKENPSKIDAKFQQRLIKELSRSGLPSGSRQGEGGVINRKYAQYELLSNIVVEQLWRGQKVTYNVESLVKEGYADSQDGAELDKLVSIISNLISSEMKVEHEDAIKQAEEKRKSWNWTRDHEWTNLLEKRDEFVSRLRDVRDDVEAEREVEADPT